MKSGKNKIKYIQQQFTKHSIVDYANETLKYCQCIQLYKLEISDRLFTFIAFWCTQKYTLISFWSIHYYRYISNLFRDQSSKNFYYRRDKYSKFLVASHAFLFGHYTIDSFLRAYPNLLHIYCEIPHFIKGK